MSDQGRQLVDPHDIEMHQGDLSVKEQAQRLRERDTHLKMRVGFGVVLLVAFFILNCFVMYLCWKSMPLSDSILGSLIGATVVQTATMTLVTVRFLFPADHNHT